MMEFRFLLLQSSKLSFVFNLFDNKNSESTTGHMSWGHFKGSNNKNLDWSVGYLDSN